MIKRDCKLQLFSDESGNHSDRYRSIGIISGPDNDLNDLRRSINMFLIISGRTCLEFKQIDGDSKKQRLAEIIIEEGLKFIIQRGLKVDVLTWDTLDSRHNVFGIDREKNFEIMYYQIITKTLHRWQSCFKQWEFYPDQKNGVNWGTINSYCEMTNLNRKLIQSGVLFESDLRFFSECVNHCEVESAAEPITQFIDIITGIIRYSFCHGDKYNEWLKDVDLSAGQGDLFGCIDENKFSNSMIPRFKCMKLFYDICKLYACQVNFSKAKYFQTFNLNGPFNLWFYMPKDYDKAPVKIK